MTYDESAQKRAVRCAMDLATDAVSQGLTHAHIVPGWDLYKAEVREIVAYAGADDLDWGMVKRAFEDRVRTLTDRRYAEHG